LILCSFNRPTSKELADLLARAETFSKAFKLAPYPPVLYKALALHYIKLGKHRRLSRR